MTEQRPVLVVVDDEQGILDVVSRFATRAGFDVVPCTGGGEGIARIKSGPADLAMVDLRMPDLGGLEVLRAIRESNPDCQAVLMTGFSSVETAVEAIKLGATDYLTKPLDFGRVQELLTTRREDMERRRSVLAMERDLARRLEFCGMTGHGPLMQDVFALIRRLAPHVRAALITGETGTGKELVARALHRTGPRRDRPFVTVNCSAVVESRFETELFGRVRGASPGATDDEPGLVEAADGGVLFLDEVGDLPLTLQPKLLRVLELGDVHRAGALEPRRVNVHVVAATTRDLRDEVAKGRFRSDLYYRLNVVELRLPALRDRREDIPYLTAAFVRDVSERLNKPIEGLTPGAERMLATARWDGNVRELRNVIERACILADGSFLTERELAASMPAVRPVPPHADAQAPQRGAVDAASAHDSLATVEREHIRRALAKAGGNKKVAAQMLGLSRRALYRRLERLDLADTITRRREPAILTTL